MTHEQIEAKIDSLNLGNDDLIFKAALSANVEYANVWVSEPRGNIGNESSYPFYFIKNQSGIYVAAVLDMGEDDLHVFVKEEHRKKGYLSSALNEVILPHLYQTGRTKQKVTFDDEHIGNYIVNHWGFSKISQKSAEKDLACFKNVDVISQKPRKITEQEFSGIKKKIDKARLYLQMSREQIKSISGKEENIGLQEIIEELVWLDDRVSDFFNK